MTPKFVTCPPADVEFETIIEFAHTYDGYRRLAGAPEDLEPIVGPVLEPLEAGYGVPEWAGIDLLRGALFFMARRGRFTWSDIPPDDERDMRILTETIRQRADGQPLVSDLNDDLRA